MQDYWKQADEILKCKDIANAMLCDRFKHIKRCLHLVDNSIHVTDNSEPQWDPIGKTRWYLNELITSFNQQMNPLPYLCVDESMIAYNGRYCGFKQYLRTKPITHRIKVFVMCCTVTRYILRWEVYVGTGGNLAVVPHGEGAKVQDGEELDGEVDNQVLPDQVPPELSDATPVDDDFVADVLAATPLALAEE